MSKHNSTLTVERLRELLHYDAETGIFTRLVRASNAIAGIVAGCVNARGYWTISVDGERFRAHRLAWFYVHGVWPKDQIDHIDGNKLNNQISNLREASNAENHQNIHKPKSNSKTKICGVSLHKPTGKFVSHICIDGKNQYLGLFVTSIEAHSAYLAAKAKLHPFFIRGE